MAKCSFEIIFALAMLAIGTATLILTNEIIAVVIKLIGERKGILNLTNYPYTALSIRFGGSIAVFIGLFVLWMCWRS